MAHELRLWRGTFFGISYKSATAAHVVEMAMGVNHGVHPLVAPAADGVDHATAALRSTGIEGHKPVVAFEQYAVGEGFHDGHPIADGRKLVIDAVDGAGRVCVQPLVNDARGEREKIFCHGAPPAPAQSLDFATNGPPVPGAGLMLRSGRAGCWCGTALLRAASAAIEDLF